MLRTIHFVLDVFGFLVSVTCNTCNTITNWDSNPQPVLWCGASAWHRPAPRGEKSHRPAPTPQAGAKISSPRPNAPSRGEKAHRPAPTPQAGAKISSPRPNAPSAPGRPNAPGRKKCSGAQKRPRAQKNAPVLNINTYFILQN